MISMVGRQSIRMDGIGSVTVMDDSPASSPNSSPSPDTLSADSRRAEALSRSRVVPSSGLGGRGRPAVANAARERSRVQTLRHAFLELQRTLPSVPPDTKLSKTRRLDIGNHIHSAFNKNLARRRDGRGQHKTN